MRARRLACAGGPLRAARSYRRCGELGDGRVRRSVKLQRRGPVLAELCKHSSLCVKGVSHSGSKSTHRSQRTLKAARADASECTSRGPSLAAALAPSTR